MEQDKFDQGASEEPTVTPGELHEREAASREFFDDWAESYENKRISPWFQYTQRLTIEQLDLVEASRVLDVGCGTGYAVRALGARVPAGKACGIDISPTMIAEAKKGLPPELSDRTEFRQANSAELPFSAGDFTHVICTNSFHHYPEPLRVLEEISRVLVPGGQLVIFENAPDLSWYTWAWDRLLRLIEKGHVRYLPSQELGALIQKAGYADVELRALRNEFLKHGKLFASIQIWSGRTARKTSH